jgi:hypothetical protein
MRYRFPHAQLFIGGFVYRWTGWFGCQLETWEWRRVPAGTRRLIEFDGKHYEVHVWSTGARKWRTRWKVPTLWTIPLDCNLDEANARLRKFKDDLRGLV